MTAALSRRRILTGLIAAPAVLKLGLWMPVKSPKISFSIVSVNQEWLEGQLQDSLMEFFARNSLVPYTDAGIEKIAQVVEKVWNDIPIGERDLLVLHSAQFAYGEPT